MKEDDLPINIISSELMEKDYDLVHNNIPEELRDDANEEAKRKYGID